MEPIFAGVRNVVIPACRLWFRWSLEGLEGIPKDGPAIVAFNHISYLDPFAAAYAIDSAGRRPRFLAKSELFANPWIGWLMRGTHQIEVRRGTPSAPLALEQALLALARGEIIVIFPEGTVTFDRDLRPMPAKTGAVRLAIRSGAPLIPAGIWGTANVLPRHFKDYKMRWWPRQDLCVRVGEPMGDMAGHGDTPEEWRATGVELMDRIAALVAGLRPALPYTRQPRRKSIAS